MFGLHWKVYDSDGRIKILWMGKDIEGSGQSVVKYRPSICLKRHNSGIPSESITCVQPIFEPSPFDIRAHSFTTILKYVL